MTASIIAVLQLMKTIRDYIIDVENAPTERLTFLSEVSGLHSFLLMLRNRVRAAHLTDPWFSTVRVLGVKNGPLDQFQAALKVLASKLEPAVSFRKLHKILTWKFTKAEVEGILIKIERFKSFASLAILNSLL